MRNTATFASRKWRVREPEDNTVTIEITVRDAYAALELADRVAQGIAQGSCRLEFYRKEKPDA